MERAYIKIDFSMHALTIPIPVRYNKSTAVSAYNCNEGVERK